ncbi:MAG: hypothetical protein NVS3B10_28380 [Polyangiales bacterium]
MRAAIVTRGRAPIDRPVLGAIAGAMRTALTVGVSVGGAGCGPGGGGPARTASAASAAPAASTSASAASADDGAPICKRVCAVQTKCGGDASACAMRCLPIARVLLPEVLERMVACVEHKAPAKCEDGEAAADARRHLVGACVVEATAQRMPEARDTIALFAKAYCDRSAGCGTIGTVSPNQCIGSARGEIMSTEGEASGGLYGSMRPSRVDAMLACLGAPCDVRLQHADEDVDRCLNAVLAKAAEGP